MYHFEQTIEYDLEINVDNLIKAIKEEFSSYRKMGVMGSDEWLEEVKSWSDDEANDWVWECIQEAINNEKYPVFIIDGCPHAFYQITNWFNNDDFSNFCRDTCYQVLEELGIYDYY